MSDNRMGEIIRESLDGIREFADVDTVIGNSILTPSGVTVIPVSKVTIGFATGGIDLSPGKTRTEQNFGGGGGTGVSITPLAFLTVTSDERVDLIRISPDKDDPVARVADLVSRSPEIVTKLKKAIFG